MFTPLSGNQVRSLVKIHHKKLKIYVKEGDVLTLSKMFVDDRNETVFSVEECCLKIPIDSSYFEDVSFFQSYEHILEFFE